MDDMLPMDNKHKFLEMMFLLLATWWQQGQRKGGGCRCCRKSTFYSLSSLSSSLCAWCARQMTMTMMLSESRTIQQKIHFWSFLTLDKHNTNFQQPKYKKQIFPVFSCRPNRRNTYFLQRPRSADSPAGACGSEWKDRHDSAGSDRSPVRRQLPQRKELHFPYFHSEAVYLCISYLCEWGGGGWE